MKKQKDQWAWLMLSLISILFLYKYGSRAHPLVGLATSFVYLGFIYVLRNLDSVNVKWKSIENPLFYFIGVLAIVIGIGAWFYIPIEGLNIDRWSVIDSFLTAFYDGIHPYFARSHEGNLPGPMPFYFFLNLPFYLTKTFFIPSVIGIILFLYYLKKQDSSSRWQILFYTLMAPFLYYEIVGRSNIFINAFLFFLVLDFIKQSIQQEQIRNQWIGFALFGLMMSTRGVFIIPALIFMMYYWRKSKKPILFFGQLAFSVIVFASTFMPLVYYFPEHMSVLTPIEIQSGGLMPKSIVGIFIIWALAVGLFMKRAKNMMFSIGSMLFLLILTYAIRLIVLHGFEMAFHGSIMDLTYFIFCVPFLVVSILERDTGLLKS